MTHHTTSPWRRWLGAALLLVAPLAATAQDDPPARVAAISLLEGQVQIAADGHDLQPATLNWPVTTGTRLLAGPGARAELHGGQTVLRLAGLNGTADLRVTKLDDDTTQVALMDGSASVRVRQLQPGERVEIDTPNLAVVARQPGEYRIDVDPRAATTRLTVHAGSATVYGEAGQSSNVGQRQWVQYSGRALAVTEAGPARRDAFDHWAAERDEQEDRSPSAQYLPREVPGYHQLDAHGEWAEDGIYGPVWFPRITVTDWAPYRYGHWAWIEPWGWTWVDDAPWGFAPSHYGRWTQIGPRWAWVPGPFGPRPVYAPAVVAFIGGDHWSVSIGSGGPGLGWFPLGPGEYWRPPYHASDRYRHRLNWGSERWHRPGPSDYFHRRPNAVTYAPAGLFGSGQPGRRPAFGHGQRLPPGALDHGRIINPPPPSWRPNARRPAQQPGPGRSPAPRAPRPSQGLDAALDVAPMPGAAGGLIRHPDSRPPLGAVRRPAPSMGQPESGLPPRRPADSFPQRRPTPPSMGAGGALREPQRPPMQQRPLPSPGERMRDLQVRPPAAMPRVQPMPEHRARPSSAMGVGAAMRQMERPAMRRGERGGGREP